MKSLILKALFIVVVFLVNSDLFARPNVLLILTDDQGYGDISLHGNPQLQTPTWTDWRTPAFAFIGNQKINPSAPNS